MHVDSDTHVLAIAFDGIIIDGFRVQRLSELPGRVVLHGAKERSLQVLRMLGGFQIRMNEPLRLWCYGDEADLLALASIRKCMMPSRR